jgi:hypothetical protein
MGPVLALALLIQAPSPAPLEPLPPAEDPAIVAALGPVYADLARARRDGQEAARKLPVKLRARLGPKLMAGRVEDVGRRWGFGASELEWVARLGSEGGWPASGEPVEATGEAKGRARAAYRDAERQHGEETAHYAAERDRQMAREGQPPAGLSLSATEADDLTSIAAARAGASAEAPCRVPNRLGRPCSRKVPGGGPCWIHRQPQYRAPR